MKLIEQYQIFGGSEQVWAHNAQTLQCEKKFVVYLPNDPDYRPLRVIYWLFCLFVQNQVSLLSQASSGVRSNFE